MARSIETRRGSSLFEAAFSLITEAIISFYDTEDKRFRYLRLDLKTPAKLRVLIEAARQSAGIHVYNQPNQKKAFLCADLSCCQKCLPKFMKPNESLSELAIYTADVDRVRALAKEIRTDKAVAKAAKKPVKPKADLKTRNDII